MTSRIATKSHIIEYPVCNQGVIVDYWIYGGMINLHKQKKQKQLFIYM